MSYGKRPFRFGVQLGDERSAEEWKAKARRAESLGYDVLLLADHFGGLLAFGAALGMAAAVTSRMRFGTLVLQNPLRHPAIVATESATLDLLSDGRFELGIGVGGSAISDYEWTGIPFEPPSTRVDQFEESVQIIKAFLANESVSLHGQHYTISDLPGLPNPVQRPHPPLLIGAGGPRMLRFAAREANIVSILPRMLPEGGMFNLSEFTSAAYLRKVEAVRAEAGDRFEQIEFNTLVQRLVFTDDPYQEAARISERWGIPADDVLTSPHTLIGTHERIIEMIEQQREQIGLTYYVVFDRYIDEFAPIVAALAGR